MTLKPGVKKGVSLLIHYLGSLVQAVRSWGRRKQMWAGKKKTATGCLLLRALPHYPNAWTQAGLYLDKDVQKLISVCGAGERNASRETVSNPRRGGVKLLF